jgi:hypothetical protein
VASLQRALRVSAVYLLVLSFARAAVSGQAASDGSFWDNRFFLPGINGTVNAIAVSGGEVYVGGNFTSADGVTATNIAQWNGANWSALGAGVNGPVNAIAIRGNEVYVGGTFTLAGGLSANRVAKWDGTNWSGLGSGIGSTSVDALAVSGSGVLYAAGDFISAGGVDATNVAKWDGAHWSALGSGVSDVYQAYASALAVMGNDLFVGGYFTEAGGASADNLAKWNGTTWSAVGGGVDDPNYPAQVSALAVSGTNLYVGGAFSTVGRVTASNIARWDGTTWSALGNGVGRFYGDVPVTALAVSTNHLFVGGSFVSAGGVTATNLAEWDGVTWAEVGGGASGKVNALAANAANVYVGGSFSVSNGALAFAMSQWNTAQWSAVSSGDGQGLSGASDNVGALAVSGSVVFAGGVFTSAGGIQARNIARWDGAEWSPVGGGVNGTVFALGTGGSDLFVGGKFTAAGGVAASNVAKWDGVNWTALGSGLNGTVYALTVSGNQLYAGGAFTNAGGVSASNVARWSGTNWSALGSGVNGTVYALSVSGSNLFVGGRFSVAGGLVASNVAGWNGGSWSALGSGVGGVVYGSARIRPPPVSALLVNGNDLFVGGDFAFAGAAAATNIARWDGTNWSALGQGLLGVAGLYPPPAVRALAMEDPLNSQLSTINHLFVGGTFIKAGGLPANNLAQWDGSQWTVVGEGINSPPPVAALAMKGGEVYVGGTYKFAGGKPASDFTIWHPWVSLQITRVGEAIRLCWPAAADGYFLQMTANVTPGSWQTVTNWPLLMGNQWSVTITEPGPSQFYRLVTPRVP